MSHEYNKDKTNNADGSEDIINSTKYISRLSLPSERLKHSISLNNEFGKQDQSGRDISNTTNKSFELLNKMETFFKNIKLAPLSTIKINSRDRVSIVSDTIKVNTNTKELTISSSLEGSQTDTRYLGDISSKITYGYTKTTDNVQTLKNSVYSWDLLISKDISENQSFSFNSSHSWKYASDVNVEILDTLTQELVTQAIPTPSQYTSSNSINYRSSQFENIDFSATLALSSAPGSKTTNIAILLDAYIPFINVPFSTEIINQSRKLEATAPQTSFSMESKITYRYNQINLKISHIYAKEKLVLDTYKFYEFSVELTRNFGFY